MYKLQSLTAEKNAFLMQSDLLKCPVLSCNMESISTFNFHESFKLAKVSIFFS